MVVFDQPVVVELPQEPDLLIQNLLTLARPLREVQDDLSADAPRQLPYLVHRVGLLGAARSDQADDFLHADPHDHIFVLNGVLVGGGWVLQLHPEPVLQLLDHGAVAHEGINAGGTVIAALNGGKFGDNIGFDGVDLLPELLGDFVVDFRRGELGDVVNDGGGFELGETAIGGILDITLFTVSHHAHLLRHRVVDLLEGLVFLVGQPRQRRCAGQVVFDL